MQKLLFVFLLTVAMCFSVPAPQGTLPVTEPTKAPASINNSHIEATEKAVTLPPQNAGNSSNQNPMTSTPIPNTPKNGTEKANGTVPAHDAKLSDNTTTVVPPTVPQNANGTQADNKTIPVPPTNATAPAQPPMNTTTTVKPTPEPANVKPTPNADLHKARAFDGPSFIGGIVLTMGLLCIGFLGFRYYKTHNRYHTL